MDSVLKFKEYAGSRNLYDLAICANFILLFSQTIPSIVADDMFRFADIRHIDTWSNIYQDTCTLKGKDTFREPRDEIYPDDIMGRLQSFSPVPIHSEETVRAPENITLHIYSNFGQPNIYSVSYGFQRNKECLHGQDSNCVVSPDFGRVKALVVNAERFKEGQNLNYIKDHFAIEEPEKFVTILNGGSIFERKFYEAVFLGGYPAKEDPIRSSHQINGKSFPLEIYMYFVDETVPSMTLTTILVVLVDESEKDNTHIKPIVDAVTRQLYDTERHYIANNQDILRRERLFHNLRESTIYNSWRTEYFKNYSGLVFQKTLDSSAELEETLADFVQTYERLEALEAELQFLDEDAIAAKNQKEAKLRGILFQLGVSEEGTERDLFVNNEALFIAQAAFQCATLTDLHNGTLHGEKPPLYFLELTLSQPPWNGDKDKIYNDSLPLIASAAHWPQTVEIGEKSCYHLRKFKIVDDAYATPNINVTQKFLENWENKYAAIEEYRVLDEIKSQINQFVFDHFHTSKSGAHDIAFQEDFSRYRYGRKTARRFQTNVQTMMDWSFKDRDFVSVRKSLDEAVDRIWNTHSFPTQELMRDVIRYLKHGEKNLNLKFKRSTIHDQIWHSDLPSDHKRRGFVEFGNMGMTEREIKQAKDIDPPKVRVEQAFQISWLIPKFGGYYYYAGSSPVPPCFIAQNVIVFKKPITMSRKQIEHLTKIPLSFSREMDVTTTKPTLKKLKILSNLRAGGVDREDELKVQVYDQPRNHLFLGNDGHHANAIELSDKLAEHHEGSGEIKNIGKITKFILIFRMAVIILDVINKLT